MPRRSGNTQKKKPNPQRVRGQRVTPKNVAAVRAQQQRGKKK